MPILKHPVPQERERVKVRSVPRGCGAPLTQTGSGVLMNDVKEQDLIAVHIHLNCILSLIAVSVRGT